VLLANAQFFGLSGQTRLQALKRDIQQMADDEQRNISQICELLLHEGVEAYKKEGDKFMQRLVAKQKLRMK